MALFGNSKKKDSDAVPNLPALDRFLTLATLALFVGALWLLGQSGGTSALIEFGISLVTTSVLIFVCKMGLQPLGRCMSTQASLEKPRNIRKFADQGWQLAVHAAMTWYELRLLQANGWKWWTEPETLWKMDWQVAGDPCPLELRRLYIAQMGIWFVTAFSHKFVEAKHKDYFVMYGHHVATLGLVALSYGNAWTPIGALVLFIHDSSDIVVDLLKMVNYAGLDGDSGLFLAEAFFVANLISWAALRLWIYPSLVIKNTFYAWGSYPLQLPMLHPGVLCRCLLIVLFLMHCWWYCLFLRILYKLLAGSSGHEAGREEYEGGSSDSEIDVAASSKKGE